MAIHTWLTVCNILAAIIGAVYAYRIIFGIVGLFCIKRYAPAKRHHRYAVVVAARNEEAVIGNLLDSIRTQNYPADRLQVFVVADNCTDGTAAVARAHGAVCYERKDAEKITKGYALQYLFECIERDFGRACFEGYFLFDADNLLKSDFISRMNDAFDSGERVIVSYRNTKNLRGSWLAASYALHWLRTSRLEHCARSVFGISARIQGTGVLFDASYVKDGWNYTSLTEDRAFTSDIVTEGGRIAYQHEAQFYDEQPTSLRVAMRQRLRWAKGHLQAFHETGPALFCGIFRRGRSASARISAYDTLTVNFPSSVVTVPLKLLEASLLIALCISSGQPGAEWGRLLLRVLNVLFFEHLSCILFGFLLFFTERRRLVKLRWYQYILYSLLFPMFSIIGDTVTLAAVFLKVTWKPIPHRSDIRIEELESLPQADPTPSLSGKK